MNNRIKVLIIAGFLFIFGIITGRWLPQWEDMIESNYVAGFWIFFGIGMFTLTTICYSSILNK